jgi:hypothetical protein
MDNRTVRRTVVAGAVACGVVAAAPAPVPAIAP